MTSRLAYVLYQPKVYVPLILLNTIIYRVFQKKNCTKFSM